MQMLGGRGESGERQRDDDRDDFEQQDRQRSAQQPSAGRAAAGHPAAQPTQNYTGGGAPRGGGFDEMDDDILYRTAYARAAWSII
jgi:single-strand DNA-binding protein